MSVTQKSTDGLVEHSFAFDPVDYAVIKTVFSLIPDRLLVSGGGCVKGAMLASVCRDWLDEEGIDYGVTDETRHAQERLYELEWCHHPRCEP